MPAPDPTPFPVVLPFEQKSGISPTRPSALLVIASRLRRRNRLNEPRYKLFWETVAIAASMLIFASLRPSTADVTGDTTRSILVNTSHKGLHLSRTRSRQTEGSKAAEAQLRQSNLVAKAFTKHFSVATMQKSELTRGGVGKEELEQAVQRAGNSAEVQRKRQAATTARPAAQQNNF
jgi:hypothetical protein